MDSFLIDLKAIYSSEDIYENEKMSRHTTFRIGGPARYYVTSSNAEQIKQTIELCRKLSVRYYIIGKGSNLLVRDEGFDGVIIEIGDKFASYEIAGDEITAQSGIRLKNLAAAARDNSLTGLEFAHGIPGSLGGAVAMNAGAYGGEMKQVIKCAKVLSQEGEIRELSLDELELGYRESIVANKNYIVLEVTLKLQRGDSLEIGRTMEELMKRRREKQPLEYPSAGSTFKRPEGCFAGKLIEDSGLGGYRVGGAMVSDKHCGFVVNYKNATAEDVIHLMSDIKNIVYEKFGVILEPEVKIL